MVNKEEKQFIYDIKVILIEEICCSNHYNVKRYQKVENLFKYQDFYDLIEKRDGHYITLENPGKNYKIQKNSIY